jgi:5-methylcytosine-specific restriction endonuclease McrA
MTTKTLTANILDPIQPTLDQRVFKGKEPRPQLVSYIEKHFFNEMANFVPHPDRYFDLYLTGSITTYQYGDDSDIDVSVIPHYDELIQATGAANANEIRKRLIKIVIDKLDGRIAPGTPHTLQHFIVPPGTTIHDLFRPGLRSAWSFRDRKWVVPPEKARAHDVQRELPGLYLRARNMAEKMKIALDTDPGTAKKLFQRIHKKRSEDQKRDYGDFSEGNIVYKYLLHEGLFDRIRRELGEYIASFDAPLENPFNYQYIPLAPAEMVEWQALSPEDKERWRAIANRLNSASRTRYKGNVSGEQLHALSYRYQGNCAYCGLPKANSWEHVIPLAKGGTNTVDNLLPVHIQCNNDMNTLDQKNLPVDNPGEITLSPDWLKWDATPTAKTSDVDRIHVIYDFEKDRIILGMKNAGLPNTIVVGTYHQADGSVTLNETSNQWINAKYFKKLWRTSFPTYPLRVVHFQSKGIHERIGTAIINGQPVDARDIGMVEAFGYVGEPYNQLLDSGTPEHYELLYDFTAQHGIGMEEMVDLPVVLGHLGVCELIKSEEDYISYNQYVADFQSHSMDRMNDATPELKQKALEGLRELGYTNVVEVTGDVDRSWWTAA